MIKKTIIPVNIIPATAITTKIFPSALKASAISTLVLDSCENAVITTNQFNNNANINFFAMMLF